MTQVSRYAVSMLAFLPFLVMLVGHWWFGLSDAFLAAPAPGERFWPLYNPLMIAAAWLGLAGWVGQTAWIWTSGPARQKIPG